MASKPISPESIISGHSALVKKIVNDLRRIILTSVPEVSEKVLPGWHAIGFRYSNRHFCAIFPYETTVKLYFEYGAKLVDSDHILEGSTKQTRFVSFSSSADVSERKIKRLVREAVLHLSQK